MAAPDLPKAGWARSSTTGSGFTSVLGVVAPTESVYTAVDIHNGMTYAVKALSKVGLEPRQQRFQQREIMLHSRASAHENVVTLYKILDSYDCIYVVME